MNYFGAAIALCSILSVAALADGNAQDRAGSIGADAPAGKPYIYKHSAGKPRDLKPMSRHR